MSRVHKKKYSDLFKVFEVLKIEGELQIDITKPLQSEWAFFWTRLNGHIVPCSFINSGAKITC